MKKSRIALLVLLLLTLCLPVAYPTKSIAQSGNIEKAQSLINSFATGDSSIAKELLLEDYIQHNLDFETGAQAFIGAVEYLGSLDAEYKVNTVRAFEDGDYVILHTIYEFNGDAEVAFDIFRFENGKIAEHWDNLSPLAEPNPSGRTQTDGATEITDINKTAENKALVNAFVHDILHGQNIDKFDSYFENDKYLQHNTHIPDGASAIGGYVKDLASKNLTMGYSKTHLLLGQGNFVLAVSENATKGSALYDLFRVENGKIAEHWDIVAKIPAKSTWKNTNGKF